MNIAMEGSGDTANAPVWPSQATRRSAAWRGARETPLLPPFILFSTFVGFGALTSQTGLSCLDTLFMSVFIFALPGQVVLVDEMARGASVLTAAIAVSATSIRLLPMTVALLPMIRDKRVPKWMVVALAQFVAVTVWVESTRRAPGVPRHLRAAYALGIAALLVGVSSSGAMIGFLVAGQVPSIIAAALLFMMPLYFLLAMLIGAHRTITGLLPILLGLVLGPIFHILIPEFDLVLTGVVGGSVSFLLAHYVLRPQRNDGAVK